MDKEYQQHGAGTDPSLIATGLDHDHDHDHDHGHDHSHDVSSQWPDPATLEHPDERTDRAHNWGTGRFYKPGTGQRIPVPIISSLPVRSRSRGRWDGDGM
jgi:ABC-type Zn2+ transport system substrate-binding protein/surface adhesin